MAFFIFSFLSLLSFFTPPPSLSFFLSFTQLYSNGEVCRSPRRRPEGQEGQGHHQEGRRPRRRRPC